MRIALCVAVSILLTLGLAAPATATDRSPAAQLQWSNLPALPDKHGFAGPFAGV